MKPVVQAKPLADVTNQSEDPDSKKVLQQRCRQRAAVAFVAVTLVALVGVAGGLTAAYIMQKEQPSIRERMYSTSFDGTDVPVKVATDSKAKIAIWADGTTTVVGEYNKGFTVYVVPATDGEVTCFLRLMDNTTTNFSTLQEFTESWGAAPQNKKNPTIDRIVGAKITDVTFLSTYAQQACYGHDVYWVTPYESTSLGMTKRSSCYNCYPRLYACFYLCTVPSKRPLFDPVDTRIIAINIPNKSGGK